MITNTQTLSARYSDPISWRSKSFALAIEWAMPLIYDTIAHKATVLLVSSHHGNPTAHQLRRVVNSQPLISDEQHDMQAAWSQPKRSSVSPQILANQHPVTWVAHVASLTHTVVLNSTMHLVDGAVSLFLKLVQQQRTNVKPGASVPCLIQCSQQQVRGCLRHKLTVCTLSAPNIALFETEIS